MPDPPLPVRVDPRGLLRQEVGALRARESRRVFDLSVHVGELGAGRDSFVVRAQDLPVVDAALRADVVSTLLTDSPPQWHMAWLVRPGTPDPHDLDLQWFSAACTAFGMHGRQLTGFFTVTRTGWRNVRTGETRVWGRLRL